MSALLLELNHPGLKLGGRQVLAPCQLSVHAGERLALIGANGAGKTSLLRLLHGLLPAEGRVLHQLPGLGRLPRQAMVFQQPFFLRLSVQRNLRLALWLAGVPAEERAERVQAALQRVGLQAMAGRDACSLSGGQRQRLALARAWALQAELLFLDEPTAHLDPGARREVERVIEGFAADGLSMVMSTHNLGQAKRLATRVLYLHEGQVLADAPVAQFFGAPLPAMADQFLRGEMF